MNDIFIILVLYVDDMLIVSKIMGKISKLKAQMARAFDMKDLGAAKQILVLKYTETKEMVSSTFHRRSMLKRYLKGSE